VGQAAAVHGLQLTAAHARRGRAGKLLRLASTVLNCELAALLLLDGQRVRVANAVGLPEPGAGGGAAKLDFSFAGWQLLSPNHEVLIVEDSAEDARCAAPPLLCSRGKRERREAPLAAAAGVLVRGQREDASCAWPSEGYIW